MPHDCSRLGWEGSDPLRKPSNAGLPVSVLLLDSSWDTHGHLTHTDWVTRRAGLRPGQCSVSSCFCLRWAGRGHSSRWGLVSKAPTCRAHTHSTCPAHPMCFCACPQGTWKGFGTDLRYQKTSAGGTRARTASVESQDLGASAAAQGPDSEAGSVLGQ